MVDFPPTSAPGRAPGGPAAPVAGAVPVPESPRATGPRPGGRPWAPSIAGAVEIGRQTPGVAPEVFATETSVFPAVRTRRGDIFVDDRGMASTADGPLPTGPSLPPIRIDEGDDLLAEEERRIRRLRIGLLVAGLVVAAAIIALGSALGLGLA